MILARHKYNPPDEVMFRQLRLERKGYGNSFEEMLSRIIENELGVNPLHDLKKTRVRVLVDARHFFAYMMKTYTKKSLANIGKLIKKDHATILHALKTVDNLKETDKVYLEIFNRIDKQVKKIV